MYGEDQCGFTDLIFNHSIAKVSDRAYGPHKSDGWRCVQQRFSDGMESGKAFINRQVFSGKRWWGNFVVIARYSSCWLIYIHLWRTGTDKGKPGFLKMRSRIFHFRIDLFNHCVFLHWGKGTMMIHTVI